MKLEALRKLLAAEDCPRALALGLPVDENSSHLRGAAGAPEIIAEYLLHPAGNSWTETGVDLSEAANFRWAGNLDFTGGEAFPVIEEVAAALAKSGAVPLFLGGDHSVTYPVIAGLARQYDGLSILHIDAHPDLYQDYEGNPHSHASPFAHIMEAGLVKRLVQVGIRTMTPHLSEQARRFGVEVHEMKDWQGRLELAFDGPVYVSVDLDGLDPAFAPGVSHPEPGGLTTREVLCLIHSLAGRVIGGDVVEYNPKCDIQHQTARVAAKILRELAGTALAQD
jgi:agmatinase